MSFPLSIFHSTTGALIAECQDFSGYLPNRKEYFTLNNLDRYQVRFREFFYDAQDNMRIIGVELWVLPK